MALAPVKKTLLLLLLFSVTCNGNQNQQFMNSCGDIQNIIFPFQLQGDPSNKCIDEYFTLSCEGNNSTVLYLFSTKHYVKSINYTSHSIRLVNVGFQSNDTCSSFPPSSLTPRDFCTSIPYCKRAVSPVTFLSCENPIQSPSYINRTGYCNTRVDSGDGYYSYVVSGKVTIWDVADSCSEEMLHISSSPLIRERGSNLPLLDFHRELGHGFEVSWYWYIGDYKRCRERASCFGDSVIVTDVCRDDPLLFLARNEPPPGEPEASA